VTGTWKDILEQTGEQDLAATLVRMARAAAHRHTLLARIAEAGGSTAEVLGPLAVPQSPQFIAAACSRGESQEVGR
jgi:hypothetical protein